MVILVMYLCDTKTMDSNQIRNQKASFNFQDVKYLNS